MTRIPSGENPIYFAETSKKTWCLELGLENLNFKFEVYNKSEMNRINKLQVMRSVE